MKNSIKIFNEQIQKYGREYAITQDMIRLGFLNLSGEELTELKEGMVKLNKLGREQSKLRKELGQLPDVESMLKEVRRLRIERVKKEGVLKKEAREKVAREKKEAERVWRIANPPHLGAEISKGLKFQHVEDHKLVDSALPVINNAEDLAGALGVPANMISWLSFHRKAATIDHYHRFKIPKSKGGYRTIASPKPMLRKAQDWVLENILNVIPLHEAAMAFRVGCSIKENAKRHQNGGIIIRIDLKDFFPSIKFPRVKGIFKSFGYNEGVATILALICTDAARREVTLDNKKYFVALSKRYLPQGACTSPTLTNIICRKLDRRLTGLSTKLGFTYTRYADDLVFSHSNPQVAIGFLIICIQKIIREEGFEIHPDKTQVMRPHQRQSVTGVVVNEQLTVSRKDLRNFRSFLHHYEKEGEMHMTKKLGKNATSYAQGYWAFIYMINPEKAMKLLTKHKWLSVKQ